MIDFGSIAFTSLPSHQFTPHIHHGISYPIGLEPCLAQDPKHQLRIEPFPGPGGHSRFIEIGGDLAASHPILVEHKNAVDQVLMGRVNADQRQRLGLDGNPKTEVIFRRPLKPLKGKSEITPR